MDPVLTIIIINYKTPQLTLDCLRTVFDQTTNIPFEVIVVDNASGDNSHEIICKAFPQVQWLPMSYNAGFARANNTAIRQSTSDVVLLLNSDTLNENNAIGKSFELFRNSGYVACGVQLLHADRTPQISGNYVMKGGLNYLLPLPYIGNFIKWLGNSAGVEKPNIPAADTTIEVDWINGAFLMVKKEAIDKAGLMDEDFFICRRSRVVQQVKKVGKLCIYGQCNVIHLQGESANKTFESSGKGYYNLYDRKGLQIMLSNFVRIRKQFGVFWYLFQLCVFTGTIPVFFILGTLHNIFAARNPFRHFPAAIGFTINMAKLWAYLPTIISNKPYFYKVL